VHICLVRHDPVQDKNQAQVRPPFGTWRPSLYRNVSLYCRLQSQMSGKRTMRILHLDAKQVELVRVLFSISMTVFVAVGSFLALRYLTGSPV
jgi:hypothetical protein